MDVLMWIKNWEANCILISFTSKWSLQKSGIGVGYFLVFPLTLRFLAEYQVSEMVVAKIR